MASNASCEREGNFSLAPILMLSVAILCSCLYSCYFAAPKLDAPLALAPLAPASALPVVTGAPCDGFALCLDTANADALKRRITLLHDDAANCRAAYERGRAQ
jgi:hypothetical protein